MADYLNNYRKWLDSDILTNEEIAELKDIDEKEIKERFSCYLSFGTAGLRGKMKTENVFDPDKEFGYKKFQTQEELVAALKKLYLDKLLPLIEKGLCGCISGGFPTKKMPKKKFF